MPSSHPAFPHPRRFRATILDEPPISTSPLRPIPPCWPTLSSPQLPFPSPPPPPQGHNTMLDDPLITTLLTTKWHRFGRSLFWTHAILYLTFVLSQTFLIWLHSDASMWNSSSRMALEIVGIIFAALFVSLELLDFVTWTAGVHQRQQLMTHRSLYLPQLYSIPGEGWRGGGLGGEGGAAPTAAIPLPVQSHACTHKQTHTQTHTHARTHKPALPEMRPRWGCGVGRGREQAALRPLHAGGLDSMRALP